MKFKMIDQYTVRCVLTEDDMIENDIKLEDFFHDREKVHDLLEVIMDKAKDEVGYELNDDILSMQIMPLPKNCLAITISGKNNQDVNDMIDNVKNIAELIDDELEDSEEENEENDGNSGQDAESLVDTGIVNSRKAVKQVADRNQTEVHTVPDKKGLKIFRFTSLSEVEGYCKTMQHPKYITSHLYKDQNNNCYYLIIEQGRLTAKTFQVVCDIAGEFAELLSHQSSSKAFISEHCDRFIHKNAIATMRKIASTK